MSKRRANKFLWELVKSLTTAELYKFKERAFEKERRYPKYVELFDLIYKQEEYDEEAIVKAFKGEKYLNHLPRFKNYLYTRILEFIRDANHGEESELHGIIEKVRIVYYKRLYHHLPVIIGRGKRIAYQIEDFHAVRKLIRFEIKVLRELHEPSKYNSGIKALLQEEQSVWELETNQVEMLRLDALFQEVWDIEGAQRLEFVNQFLADPKIGKPEFAKSNSARIIQLQINWMCSFFREEYGVLIDGANQIIEIFEKAPGLMEDRVMYESLTKAILYSSQIQAYLGQVQEAQNQFSKLKVIAEADKRVPQLYLEQETIFELSIAHVSYDYQIGESAIIRFLKKEKEYFADLNSRSEIKIAHLAASFWLSNGSARKALPWISRNRNRKNGSVRPDYIRFSRLLFVMCHWELENVDVVEREIRSIRTSWGRQKLMNPYFDFFLDLFSRLVKQKTTEKEILSSALTVLDSKKDIPFWINMGNYFDLKEWIVAKLQKSTVFDLKS